jgi:hypothetical protein
MTDSNGKNIEENVRVGVRHGLEDAVALGACPDAAMSDQERLLLTDIETRLTEEMNLVVDTLREFARRMQAIGEEVPESAQFAKLITFLVPLMVLQIGNALALDLKKGILADDGALYLSNLGLSFGQFFKEFEFEGRKFLGIAKADPVGYKVFETVKGGDNRAGNDDCIHDASPVPNESSS